MASVLLVFYERYAEVTKSELNFVGMVEKVSYDKELVELFCTLTAVIELPAVQNSSTQYMAHSINRAHDYAEAKRKKTCMALVKLTAVDLVNM